MSLRRPEVTIRRSTEPIWWVLAGILGIASLWLPQYMQLHGDRRTEVLVVEVSLFFSGALIGSLRPQRVWRWWIATFVAFTIYELSTLGSDPVFVLEASSRIWEFIRLRTPEHLMLSMPVLAGAYLGSYLCRRGL